ETVRGTSFLPILLSTGFHDGSYSAIIRLFQRRDRLVYHVLAIQSDSEGLAAHASDPVRADALGFRDLFQFLELLLCAQGDDNSTLRLAKQDSARRKVP